MGSSVKAVIIFLFCVCVSLDVTHAAGQQLQLKIIENILTNYSSSVWPKNETDEPVSYTMELQIKEYDVNTNAYEFMTLGMKSYFISTWKDHRLTWNPADFGQVEFIFMKPDKIWQPKFVSQLKIEDLWVRCYVSRCIINHVGKVTCEQHCVFNVNCNEQTERWPFETIYCSIQMGSWDYLEMESYISGLEAKLVKKTSDYKGHWRIISIQSSIKRRRSQFHNKLYPVASIAFSLTTRNGFYFIMLTIPALCVAALNLLALTMPIKNNMRYAVLLGNLLIHFQYFQYLVYLLPRSPPVIPSIVAYFRDSIVVTVFMLVVITISKKMNSNQYPLPRLVDSVISILDAIPYSDWILPAEDKISVQPLHEIHSADETGLVASNPVAQMYAKQWNRFCLILERLILVITASVYLIMILSMVPSKTWDHDEDSLRYVDPE
ncbi:acetylcholine receptor subunit beta-type unc-29-like [Uranotaenia lowii]|uniref:acetylcholine receptor subunit beta-type unc-29-like n=1 Tax=Uranotaenia lowii TaxID=190385 RepID=UPI0024786EF9|nr:acetylcholine receptor subunit beta-type unc-29-like [Uranotaenia lowii]